MTASESETYLQSMILSLEEYLPQVSAQKPIGISCSHTVEQTYNAQDGLFLPTFLVTCATLYSTDEALKGNLFGLHTRGREVIYDLDTIKQKFNFFSSRFNQTKFEYTETRLRELNTEASDMSMSMNWYIRSPTLSPGATSILSSDVTPIKLRQAPEHDLNCESDVQYDPEAIAPTYDHSEKNNTYMALYMKEDLVDPDIQKSAVSLRRILDRALAHGEQLESVYTTHCRPSTRDDLSIPTPLSRDTSKGPSTPTKCICVGKSPLHTDVEYELAAVDETCNGLLTQFLCGLISKDTLVSVLVIGLAAHRDACVDFWVRRAGCTGVHVMTIDAFDSPPDATGDTAPVIQGSVCAIHSDLDKKGSVLLDVAITERFRSTVSSHPLSVKNGDVLCPLNQQTFINSIFASTDGHGVPIVSALCLTSQSRYTSDPHRQERSHFRTLLGELIIALGVLAHRGMLVCKLVNTWQPCTVSILRFLSLYFADIRFIRPLQCSPIGNEQYVLCTGYLVESAMTRSHVAGLLLHFQQISLNDDGRELMAMSEIPDNWISAVVDWNNTKLYAQVAHMEAVCAGWQSDVNNTASRKQGGVMSTPVELDRLSFIEFQSDEYAHLVTWRKQHSLSRPPAWWWDNDAVTHPGLQQGKTTVYLNASMDTALAVEVRHHSSIVRESLAARSFVVQEQRDVLDKTVARFHVHQFHQKFASSDPRSYIIHRSQEEWVTQDLSGRVSPVSVIVAGKDTLWVINAPGSRIQYSPPIPSSAFSSSASLVSTKNMALTQHVKWDFQNPLLPGTVAIGTVDVALKRLTIFQIILLPGSPTESLFMPISTKESEHLARVYCSAIRSVVVAYAPPMSTRDVDDAHMALDNEHTLVQCPGIVDTASSASDNTSQSNRTTGWSIVNVTRRHHPL
jgi:hypothetical protein